MTVLEEIPDAYRLWMDRVNEAALRFEGRWSQLTLKRVAPLAAAELARRLEVFRKVYATVGLVGPMVRAGRGVVEAYAAATEAMTAGAAAVADDGYLLGRCEKTGVTVVIATNKAVLARARALYGEKVVHFAPDEIAGLFAAVPDLKRILEAKQKWPGAEILEVRA